MLIFYLKFFNMRIYGRFNNNRYEDILEWPQFTYNNFDTERLQDGNLIQCHLSFTNKEDILQKMKVNRGVLYW